MVIKPNTKNLVPLLPYTDLGNARRYARLFNDRCKYIVEANQWYLWNGKRWEADTTGTITRDFTKVLDDIENDRVMLEEAFLEGNISDSDHKRLIKKNTDWHHSSQSLGKIHSAIKLARTQEGISKSFSEFDSKGHYLGVKNRSTKS